MEQTGDLRQWLLLGANELGLSLTHNHLSQFSTYHRELAAWNKKINLTAITDTKQVAIKHFLDSIACIQDLDRLNPQARVLDVGSGAGFPGLPLKILRPDLNLTLLEPNQKKTSFLRHLIGTLELQGASVISKTIEQFAHDMNQHRFTYILTRALNVTGWIHMALPLISNMGMLVLWRSEPWAELKSLHLRVAKEPSYLLPYGFGTRFLTFLEAHS